LAQFGHAPALGFEALHAPPLIPELLIHFPEWRYVVVIRDPKDVIASEIRVWKKDHSREKFEPSLIPKSPKK
jgi:hypothetical protein